MTNDMLKLTNDRRKMGDGRKGMNGLFLVSRGMNS